MQSGGEAVAGKLGSALGNLASPLAALAPAIAAAFGGAAIASGVKAAFDLGGSLSDLAAKTGLAVDQLFILNAVAKDNGIEDVSAAVNKLQKNLSGAALQGGGAVNQALESLGLNAQALLKQSPVEQFRAIGDAINGIRDPARKTATAMELFGKSGADLLVMFADSGAIEATAKALGFAGGGAGQECRHL
jgi:hypothetical protein